MYPCPTTTCVEPLQQRLALISSKDIAGNIVPDYQLKLAQDIRAVCARIIDNKNIPSVFSGQFTEHPVSRWYRLHVAEAISLLNTRTPGRVNKGNCGGTM